MTHEELLDQLKPLQLTYHTLDRYYGEDFDKEGCGIRCFSALTSSKITPEDFVEIPYTIHGDYVPCSVSNISNSRLIQKQFQNVISVWGSFSYSVLFVQLKDLAEDEELFDTILSLCEYPVLDEQDEFELIEELAQEAWDSWIEYDFKRSLEKHIEKNDFDCDQYKLKDVFYQFISKTGHYFESGLNDVVIDVDGIVERMIEKYSEDFWEILEENKKDEI